MRRTELKHRARERSRWGGRALVHACVHETKDVYRGPSLYMYMYMYHTSTCTRTGTALPVLVPGTATATGHRLRVPGTGIAIGSLVRSLAE